MFPLKRLDVFVSLIKLWMKVTELLNVREELQFCGLTSILFLQDLQRCCSCCSKGGVVTWPDWPRPLPSCFHCSQIRTDYGSSAPSPWKHWPHSGGDSQSGLVARATGCCSVARAALQCRQRSEQDAVCVRPAGGALPEQNHLHYV